MRIRIILADDHPVVRIGARAIIEKSEIGEIVAEAGNADQLFDVLAKTPCDVLISDFSMPGGQQPDGLAMMEAIARRYPKLPVLMLSVTSNLSILRFVVSAGVLGLVDKSSGLDELPAAIQAVHRGSNYVSRALKQRIAEMGEHALSASEAKPPSPKEFEVLRMLASGKTVTQIAEQVNRSITTISKQKSDAMRKLGIKTDVELYGFLKNAGLSS
ncbi:MAG: response regulator transcription factor [Rhodanobacter sp.]